MTNGPMVFLQAEGGRQPGGGIRLSAKGGKIRVEANSTSQQPLRSLELICNGQVVGQAKVGANAREAQVEAELEVAESRWVAVRATEEDLFLTDEELSRYRKLLR